MMPNALHWRTLPDGRVEVLRPDGSTYVPTFTGDGDAKLMEHCFAQWGPLAVKHANRTGLPVAWVLGVICAESAGRPAVESSAGAYGLMQLMPMWWRGHSKAEMADPDRNVEFGTDLLAAIVKGQLSGQGPKGLPAVASVYNCGGGAKDSPHTRPVTTATPWGMCENVGYISRVVSGSNYMVMHGASPELACGQGGGTGSLLVGALLIGTLAMALGVL